MAVHLLSNVRAVTPEEAIENATIATEDGRILSIEPDRSYRGARDGMGAYCLPGLIDTHSDVIERELSPRPTVRFDAGFTLRSIETRFLAAGITVVCHGVSFAGEDDHVRSPEVAAELVAVIAARRAEGARVDHRALFRLPARAPGVAGLAADHRAAGQPPGQPSLVAVEDHTPGQGQFRDLDRYKSAIPPEHRAALGDLDAEIARRIAEAGAREPDRQENLGRVRELHAAGRVRILAHDAEDADRIDQARGWGAVIAEFPISLEAARAATERGMPVVLGAPNVLLGGSHSGNASAEDLIAAGYCTGLASDYAPATLPAAAFDLADRKVIPFAEAIRLVTAGPAEVIGVPDRGRVEPGCPDDLILVVPDGRWPRVARVLESESSGSGHHSMAVSPASS